ncbi:hypothetical protein ACHAWF_012495 [Thalassiosira exigua]
MAPLYDDDESSHDDSCMDVDFSPVKRSQDASAVPTDAGRRRARKCASKSDDPFLYYSDDHVRMKTLKLEDDRVTDGKGEKENAKPIERKTRISFELHPSLIMEDMLEELEGCNDDYDELMALDCELSKGDEQAANVSGSLDLLKQLLEM